MKPITILLFAFFVLLASCSEDDTPKTLPPATQTGAGTFACLVNGEVFVHEDGLINCYYQYVEGGYYFSISGKKDDAVGLFGIQLSSIQKEIYEGQTYPLLEEAEGNVYGGALA